MTNDDTQVSASRLVAAVGVNDARPYPQVPLLSASHRSPFWLREDPFHDGWLWDATPSFAPRFVARREFTDGEWRLVREPAFLDYNKREGRALWSRCMNSPNVHQALSLLNGFQHATSRQLFAAMGLNRKRSSNYLLPAFNLGLVQRGAFPGRRQTAGRLPKMYALNDDRPLRRLLGLLDDRVAYRILGNNEREVHTAGRHVRHDMLAFELALRVMETQPDIVAVTGTNRASPEALFPGAENMPEFAADLVLHRRDGLRIAVEIAAARNTDHLRRTVRKWSRLMASLSRPDSGLVVVIVNAQKRRHAQMASDLRRILAAETTPGVLTHLSGAPAMDTEVLRARAQVHLASWIDWFPSGQAVSEAGRGMFTTTTPDGERWVGYSLADSGSYGYEPAAGRRWPTPTSDTSWLVPAWAGTTPRYRPEDITDERKSVTTGVRDGETVAS